MGKTKILMLITELDIGGAEKIVFYQARGLMKKGYDVHVACLYGSGEMSDAIKRCGIPVHFLHARKKTDIRVLFRLRQLLKHEYFDILHCHLFHANIIGRFAALGLPGTKIIATSHVMEVDRPYRAKIEGITSFLVSAHLGVSKSVTEFLHTTGNVPAKKLFVVYNGIDPNEYISSRDPAELKKELGIKTPLVIGSVGRLHEQKGYIYLLEAVSLLIKQHSGLSVLIAGEGPLRAELEKYAKELGVTSLVHFIGFRKDVPDVLNAMDIFVLPSIWEGFGLVVTEAMALEKPVVATKVDGVPEIVLDSQTGYIVPPGNARVLADRISELLADSDKRREMARKGKQRAAQFSVEKMVDNLITVYNAILTNDKR